MSTGIECFWVEPTGCQRRWLRRFVWSSQAKCEESGYGYHNAMFQVSDAPIRVRADGSELAVSVGRWRRNPNWPIHCECGYEFRDKDEWQILTRRLYRAGDGREFTIDDMPAGAMFDAAFWLPDGWRGADGISATVKLPPAGPADYWHVDGPAKGGGHWTRTGTPPKITANPSILTPRYHGWLRDGFLFPA